jgi:agmatine deiminase
MFPENTPKSLNYHFPAEFSKHDAMWLSWPHKQESWPGKIDKIYPSYCEFIKHVAASEKVNINVAGEEMKESALIHLGNAGVNTDFVNFFFHPTNDAWCRDHGPAFLINPNATEKKMIVKWNYNAWGGKYPPFDLDNQIPISIAEHYRIPFQVPGIVMEGGSVDFNGRGTLLTTTSCLLNPNRNPHLSQATIEMYLREFYGVENILWLGDGIVGDDTDGHIDDITRFINVDTVVTVTEPDVRDDNHEPLQENLNLLKRMKLENGNALNIIELPMPAPVIYEGQRLPASYANFYIANGCVVVPIFNDRKDDQALKILEQCFPGRKVIGVDSSDIIWGLGSFHCLSQQEPSV